MVLKYHKFIKTSNKLNHCSILPSTYLTIIYIYIYWQGSWNYHMCHMFWYGLWHHGKGHDMCYETA